MPNRRLNVTARNGRVYVDVIDLAGMLRARAHQYRAAADGRTLDLIDPATLAQAGDRDLVTRLDEALAWRLVAEELEQRADALDRIG